MSEQPKSVLIVDDDEDIRSVLASYIQRLGYLPVEASQGESAVDMMDRGFVPSVIISDIGMPIMDGTSFLNVVEERYPEVPFVILTGTVTDALIARTHGRRVQILEKPCEMRTIGEVLHAAIASNERR